MDLFNYTEDSMTCNVDLDLIIHSAQILATVEKDISYICYGVIKVGSEKYAITLGMHLISSPSEIIENGDYTTLRFKKGEPFSKHNYAYKDTQYAEKYFTIQSFGKMNHMIPYEYQNMITINVIFNNQELPFHPRLSEVYNSFFYRDKGNPKLLKRFKPEGEYLTMTVREMVSQTSTAASTSFQDPSMMNLINVNRPKKDEIPSKIAEYMGF